MEKHWPLSRSNKGIKFSEALLKQTNNNKAATSIAASDAVSRSKPAFWCKLDSLQSRKHQPFSTFLRLLSVLAEYCVEDSLSNTHTDSIFLFLLLDENIRGTQSAC